MPRSTRRKLSKPVGPFDLSKRRLPGGTEMEALATGIALERERGLSYQAGYGYAATLANRSTLKDVNKHASWFIADASTGLLRNLNTPQLFTEFQDEMEEIFTNKSASRNITVQEFSKGDAWKRVTGMTKNTPLTGPFEPLEKRYVKIKDGVFMHHRMTAYPMPPPKIPPQHRIAY